MAALILLIVLPLMVLNFLGGMVSGVWLMILGDWGTFFFGLGYMFAGAFILSFFMLPVILLAMPAAAAGQRSAALGFALAMPALLWTYGLVAVSCAYIFSAVVSQAENVLVPYLLWGYAVALAPWTFMASKEGRDGYAGMIVFFAQLGTIAMIIAVLRDPTDISFWRLIYWVVPPLLIGMVLQFVMAAVEMVAQRERYHGT
jgi:hypothetical protein